MFELAKLNCEVILSRCYFSGRALDFPKCYEFPSTYSLAGSSDNYPYTVVAVRGADVAWVGHTDEYRTIL